MGLPAWLSVEALKRRIDVELPKNDVLLEEYLLGALEQAQEPPPLGTGRLLEPAPGLAGDGTDTLDPVTREVVVTNRRVIIPDARAITAITADGEPVETYGSLRQNGLIVQVELPRTLLEEWGWEEATPYSELAPAKRLPLPDRTITITGRFGFVAPPMVLKEAIYTLAARRFYESEAEYADTVKVAEGASASVYYKQLPPSVAAAFGTYALADAIGGLS